MIPENWQRKGSFRIDTKHSPTPVRVDFDDSGVTLNLHREPEEGQRVKFWTSADHWPHLLIEPEHLGTVERVEHDVQHLVDVYPDGYPRDDEWNGCLVWTEEDVYYPWEPFESPAVAFRPWESIAPFDVTLRSNKSLPIDVYNTKRGMSVTMARSRAQNLFLGWGPAFEALYYHVITFVEETQYGPIFKYVCSAASSKEGIFEVVLVIKPRLAYTWHDFQKECWKDASALTEDEQSQMRVALDWKLDHGLNSLIERP